jgi:N6-adenosine-specific RNA methylase IME4
MKKKRLAPGKERREQRAIRERELAEAIAREQARLGGMPLYGVLYVDPPWDWESYDPITGMQKAPLYPKMTVARIIAMKDRLPAAKDCVLFLWTTVPMRSAAMRVMEEWGFEPKSEWIWRKMTKDGTRPKPGTGYWDINIHEILLIGTKGSPVAPAPGTQPLSIIDAPVGEHSEKPAIFAELIAKHYPNVPKLEMFARRQREGWDVWGVEVESTTVL